MAWQRVIFANEFDAQSILGAITDNTPTVIAIGASTLFGRRAAGDIGPITYANVEADLTGLSAVDGTRAFTGTVSGVAPTSDAHLSTKGYVDGKAQGLDIHDSVVVNSDDTSNEGTGYAYANSGGASGRGQITFTAGPTTIDGVTLANSDRILNSESGAAGGIYVRTSANVWDRATDFDEDDEVTASAFIFVEEGTDFADSGWTLTTDDPIIIGGGSGTSLAWAQFSGAGQVVAGTGMTKSGNTINVVAASAAALDIQADTIAVNPDGTTLDINGTGPGTLQVAAGGISDSHVNASADIATSKLNLDDATMAVDPNMNTHKLTGLAAGTVAGDSVRYEQVLLLAGGTMTGTLDLNGQSITMGAGDIDYEGGKAQNMLLDPLASPPGTPGVGQVYYDTASPGLYIWFA